MDSTQNHSGGARGYSLWFVGVVAFFVTSLITANVMAVKLVSLFGLALDAGTLIFPVTYIFGDVLTEVYGYRVARRVIWLGFLCNLLAVAAISLGRLMPAAPFWEDQAAYEAILGYAPRLLLASFIAYLVGEFANSYILAKLKIFTRGRFLWSRTISSTLVGQALDSAIFTGIAFAGNVPAPAIFGVILTQWLAKSSYEAAATPLTYFVVNRLKRAENLDVYDRDTRFNPLLVGR